ncbi:g12786 [Coccomyxa viridis]|uniref:G12786 protein n=1 Tax=Coccomyxa viridis TaxID=1274662 RepID=A0ABP1GB84_9CHLO
MGAGASRAGAAPATGGTVTTTTTTRRTRSPMGGCFGASPQAKASRTKAARYGTRTNYGGCGCFGGPRAGRV